VQRHDEDRHRRDACGERQLVRQQDVYRHPRERQRSERPGTGEPLCAAAHASLLRATSTPAGRQASTTATAAKKKRLPQSAARYLLAVSTVPSTSAATRDPVMLPMPPTAT